MKSTFYLSVAGNVGFEYYLHLLKVGTEFWTHLGKQSKKNKSSNSARVTSFSPFRTRFQKAVRSRYLYYRSFQDSWQHIDNTKTNIGNRFCKKMFFLKPSHIIILILLNTPISVYVNILSHLDQKSWRWSFGYHY